MEDTLAAHALLLFLLLGSSPKGSKSKSPTDEHVSIRAYPQIVLFQPGRGGAVRITVRWPREREGLVGYLGYQYAFPGESGHMTRDLDSGSPNQFIRVFERLPYGVNYFVAETCTREGKECRRAEVLVEVH